MHRIFRQFVAASLMCSSVLFAQATQPAAADSLDVAAVKSATSDFFTALIDDDVNVAKKQFGGSDDDFKSIDQLHQLVVAIKAYRAAADKQFPGASKGLPMNSDMDPKTMAAKVQHEKVTITGDDARMQDGTQLKRIDGKWKVTDMLGDARTKQVMSRMMPALIKATQDTTPEITQGKYASYDDADKAMQSRMRAAAMAAMTGGNGAATQPAR